MNTVEAVKGKEKIADVKSQLKVYGGSDLYSDIWSFGINTALRISDLLKIKYSDIDYSDPETPQISLKESKTGKVRDIELNGPAMEVIHRRHKAHSDDVYLFQVHSNRSSFEPVKPVSRETVARMFKQVGDKLKIKLGTHSMRKTRGYAMYKAGFDMQLICQTLNHSSEANTRRYIGIEKEDVQKTYKLEL